MFDKNEEPEASRHAASLADDDRIAIIGLSGRYPGGANSPELLWDILASGKDAVSDVAGDRWDLGWHNPDQDRENRIYAPSGGFLDQIDQFDAEFFGISPREAQQIDPQQRLLLELAWEAFEDAGIPPRTGAASDVGVFVGISNNDYGQLGKVGIPDAYSNTGVAFSIAANRISYVFDLHGPSFAVDTACSSSLVAVHQACSALRNGECKAALTGGINILADIQPWLGFSRASMLSPEGRCKSFDESGNGYVRAEGGGLVLLKPLRDAERDGDNILCVIRASGVNSDGRTLGLSMPNGDAQAALLEQIYGRDDIETNDVFYVEAHGTGTSVGDPIECEALGRVLGRGRDDGNRCNIGSIKSNIGHLESGSGIAGLTKMVLAMKHREIPANLHFNTPNPKIEFDNWKLSVVDKPLPFPEREAPVMLGINSFGFGGTNAHVVLEEYRGDAVDAVAAPVAKPADFLILSAQSEGALKALATEFIDMLRAPDADWTAIAGASALCRAPLRQRLVVLASDAAEAATKLEAWLAETPPPGVATGTVGGATVPTGFVFSGNGPQWWGMGRELLAANPVFRARVEEIDAIFQPLSGWSLVDEMARDEADSRIQLTEIAQPMLFAQQMGMVAVLKDAGIAPNAVFGHSVGEVAAACASGALSLEQATQVIFLRSRGQAKTAGLGKMAAIGLSADAVAEIIETVDGWLEIAAINGPDAVTVAGDEAALEILVEKVTTDGKFARLLQLDYPFHTKAMDRLRDDLLTALADLKPSPASIPFISTVTGAQKSGETLTAEYWFDNVRQPVQFHGAVQSLLEEHGIGLFLEIGPHPVLKDYVAQTARSEGMQATALQTLRRPSSRGPESDVENIATAIAAAHANGASDLEALFTRPAEIPALPTYPWQRTRHWRGATPLPDTFTPVQKDHPLLGARLPRNDGMWEAVIDKENMPYLRDHVVQGAVLFPGAGYLEMCLSSGQKLLGEDRILDVETFQILRPLVLGDEGDPLVQTLVDNRDNTVEISSRRDMRSADHTVHVRARLSAIEDATPDVIDIAVLRAAMPIKVSTDEHYQNCIFRGMEYGKMFQGVKAIALTEPDSEARAALAEISLDFLSEDGTTPYRSHPTVFDSCLQAAITLIAQVDPRNVSMIPIQFERIRSYAPLEATVLTHIRVIKESERSLVADFDIMSTDGRVLMSVTGGRCQKANLTGAMRSPLTAEWWRTDPDHPNSGALPDLPAVADITLDAQEPQDADVAAKIDALAAASAVGVLDKLRPEGDRFDTSAFARHSRIRRDGIPLLERLLGLAEQTGAATRDGRGWIWNGIPDDSNAGDWAEIFLNNPRFQAEMLLISNLGEQLEAQLLNKDAETGGASAEEQVYDTAPAATETNALVADLLTELIAKWPSDRPIRVLEVGGGTGGLTSWLLPLLPPARTDYVFSDPSEGALGRAERRFGDHGFVRTAELSLSIDAHAQGLPLNYFDLVIVNQIAGASKTPVAHLDGLSAVLADGARMIAVSQGDGALAELVLTERVKIAPSDLENAGLKNATAFERGRARVLFAEAGSKRGAAPASDAETETHLIIAEEPNGFADLVATELRDCGHIAVVIGDNGDFPAALKDTQADRVIYLASRRQDHAPDALLKTQMSRNLAAVRLVAAMEDARQTRDCTLTLITRGGFADANGSGPIDPSEAALWGMGRVIANEHLGLEVRLIDLHSTDEGADTAALLADELQRRDDETEVQLSGGHRYVSRLRSNSPSDESRQAGQTEAAFALDFIPPGGIDSLYLRALERTEPGAQDVEIAVKAAGLNFRDVLWCMGMLPEEAVEHGFSGPTIGMECAGEVVRVGPEVTHVAPGDRVVAFASSCFGSHVTTHAKSVEKMPEGMAFSEAATIPTTFLTAWYGLDYLARLEEGETILIHGAAGGVGIAAIQVAKLKGATIIGTAGSPQKRRMLEMLGVDHVLNSRTLEFADDVMKITEGVGVDVVLNSLAGEAITKSLGCLRPFGRFLEIGKRDLYANSRIGLRPFRNNLSYFGIDADTLLIERPKLAGRLFSQVIEQFRTKALTPLPHQVVPVSRAGEAFRAMQQSRHVGKLVVSMEMDKPETLPVVQSQSPVRAGGTYLVTGGLGGFGLATARWLVEQGADALALVSRSGAKSEEAQAALKEFTDAGVAAEAFAADISDPDAVNEMLGKVRSTMPPLIGVIHSAAVIEDAPILNIEADQMERVFQPKLIGAWNLHQATQDDPLEMFVMYSSSSAVVGNPGQGAYVAANLYLDALAQYRRAEGRPGLAVGWGAIQDAGFLTRHENVRDMLKSRTGLDATPAAEALADLGQVSAAGSRRISVARFDLGKLHQMLPAARTPRFAPVIPTDATAMSGGGESLRDMLAAMPKSEIRDFVLKRILENTARVIGTTASQVKPDVPLADLGLDSLMAVELAGTIERDVEQSVPVMQLLGAESLSAVADFVLTTLGLDTE